MTFVIGAAMMIASFALSIEAIVHHRPAYTRYFFSVFAVMIIGYIVIVLSASGMPQ